MMQDVSSIVQVYLCLFISSLIFIHDFLFASLFQTINNKTNQNKIPIHVLFRQDILKISTNNILFLKKILMQMLLIPWDENLNTTNISEIFQKQ